MTYQKVRNMVKNGMDIIEAENEMFETNHADMGFLLAKNGSCLFCLQTV